MTLTRLLEALEAEDHGRMPGNQRLATICFPHAIAVVPNDLAVSVLKGKWEVCGV